MSSGWCARAAFEIGNRKDKEAFGALVDSLDDENERVKEAAAGALLRITGEKLPDSRAWKKWLGERQ